MMGLDASDTDKSEFYKSFTMNSRRRKYISNHDMWGPANRPTAVLEAEADHAWGRECAGCFWECRQHRSLSNGVPRNGPVAAAE